MIHILTGWSKLGGSTEANISLTNAFNKNGYECCLYGSDPFPAKRCNFKYFADFRPSKNDILISHFINPDAISTFFNSGYSVSKHVLSCHESELFPLKFMNYKIYDKIHFVSKWQKDYHRINHPSFICPNVVEKLNLSDKTNVKGIFSVIGSIDKNKNTHVSIQRALKDGAKEVLIYGNYDKNNQYFREYILPLVNKNKNVKLMGIEVDKQKMYDSCERVYLSSFKETWGYLIPECKMTNTELRCTQNINKNIEIWDEKRILNLWVKELEI